MMRMIAGRGGSNATGFGRPATRTGWSRRRWAAVVGAACFLVVATLAGAYIARDRAKAELSAQTQVSAGYRAALLRTEIERYRSLPAVLSRDRDLLELLKHPSPRRSAEMDRKLVAMAQETAVSVLFLLDMKGHGVAVSAMLDDGRRFCPSENCRRRFYFTEALRVGSAQFYALGRPKQRAGFYFSHVVRDEMNTPVGVIVAKVEFGAIQQRWGKQRSPAIVTDEHGVVVISSVPQWLGHTLSPLSPSLRERLKASRQFGVLPLDPLPAKTLVKAIRAPILTDANLGRGEMPYVAASVPLDTPGWHMFVFSPAEQLLNQAALAGGGVALLASALMLTLLVVLLRRRQRRQAMLEQQIAMREELEKRVAERTRALTNANAKLVDEMERRRTMEANLLRLQDELVQANKLTALGQIAAGVAHEVNQPLAAIRTFAASGRKFILKGDVAEADRNFAIIDDLTGRIKLITDELRAFARRTPREIVPVSVDAAISGALLLINHRLHLESVELVREKVPPDLMVMAERIRLEQVLVNLLQNAIDAVRDRPDAKIELKVITIANKLAITVADNGPGLSKAGKAALFMPFSTTKQHGLGLGLAICREIATELGGELALDPTPLGASFTLRLNGPGSAKRKRSTVAGRVD